MENERQEQLAEFMNNSEDLEQWISSLELEGMFGKSAEHAGGLEFQYLAEIASGFERIRDSIQAFESELINTGKSSDFADYSIIGIPQQTPKGNLVCYEFMRMMSPTAHEVAVSVLTEIVGFAFPEIYTDSILRKAIWPDDPQEFYQEILQNQDALRHRFSAALLNPDEAKKLAIHLRRERLILKGKFCPSLSNQKKEPTPPSESEWNHLELIVDLERRTVKRKGYELTVKLDGSPRLWEVFLVLWRTGEKPASDEEIIAALDGESEKQNLRRHRTNLRERFIPLRITIPNNENRLVGESMA